METASHPWEIRFDWTLTVFMWGSFLVGLFLSTVDAGATPSTVGAGALIASYVLTLQVLPRSLRSAPLLGELLAVLGVASGLVAIAITGGLDSPYLLYLGAPVFFATAFLGTREGLETALLAAAGLWVTVGALGQNILGPPLFQSTAVYVLIAVAFSQARRILVEERERTAALRDASVENIIQVERLIAANNLLLSLADLADAAELNPVTVGEAALRDLSLALPFTAGQVAIDGGDGTSVLVADRGGKDTNLVREEFEIGLADRRVGEVVLWCQEPLSSEDRSFVLEALRPVALAFDNILLLRTIAKRAVREERVRLARDLHDEIGPELASLGLALDVSLHQYETTPELARQLETIRYSVSELVEEIRRTVADLREDVRESVVQQVHAIAGDVDAAGIGLVVEIDERRPPRRSIAVEVGAIVSEAVRNSMRHARPTSIRIAGFVDKDEGKLIISDDGTGFDPNAVDKGHFGLIGIKERAARIDADLAVESSPGSGTSISVHWGSQ